MRQPGPGHPRRQRATLLGVAAATLVVVFAGGAGRGALADPVYLQIVAHEDDDFLFMNPDLGNQIAGGYGAVTIYTTAGQSVGTSDGTMNREQFARARQRGELAAYAQMVGVANSWTRSVLTPDGVHAVERYTLNAAPNIQLIFMGLPDGGDDVVPHNYALKNMWDDAGYVTDTIVPACAFPEACFFSPLPLQYYDRAGVLAVLQALVASYDPIHVRTLDPQNFESVDVSFDNADHVATARFADAVLANHHGPAGSRRYTVIYYKGYGFLNYPQNLGAADYAEKAATANTYKPYDPNYVTFADSYDGYYRAMWERYPASTTWLERANSGQLVALTVEDRRVLYWYESAPGGAWLGPVFLAGSTPLAPHLTLLRRPDGLLQIFALRLPLEREHWLAPGVALPLQEVVTAVQVPATGAAIAFGAWTSLGTPDGNVCATTSTCQFNGVQAATVDGTGRIWVFARNSLGRVTATYQSAGVWSSWATIGGSTPDIVDGIAASTRDDGRVEAFATARTGAVLRFIQQSPAGLVVYDSSFGETFSGAASAPTVTKNQDGRPEIFYREATTGRVLTAYVTPGDTWAGPVLLYGDSGVGPVAAIRRGGTGHIMLFERNVWAGISATWQTAPNDVFYLQWQLYGGYLNEYPSAATDGAGRVVVAVKGGDGNLYFRRESSAASVGSFAGWALIESPCTGGAGSGDGDLDGFCDAIDDCPNVANPQQQDLDANGTGDACECGDVDLNNTVDGGDVTLLRGSIAAKPPGLTPTGVARCSVIGTALDCDVRDVTILRRRVAIPPWPPSIARVCAAANP